MRIIAQTEDVARLKRDLDLLQRQIPQAQAQAVNKTARAGKKPAAEFVRRRYNVKIGRLNKAWYLKRANARGNILWGEVGMRRGGALSLLHFGARPRKPAARSSYTKEFPSRIRRPARGVSVEVLRGERKTVRGSFAAPLPSGGSVAIWRRTGEVNSKTGREKIERLTGPSVQTMFGHEKVRRPLVRHLTQELAENMARETARRLRKAGFKA